MGEVVKLTLAITSAFILFSVVIYIAVSNYKECREQFSVLYCVTTHLIH